MNCHSCGAAMPAESRFCPECGAPAYAPPAAPPAAGQPPGGTPPTAPPVPPAGPPTPGAPTPPMGTAPPAGAPPAGGEAVPAPAPARRGMPTALKVAIPVVLLAGAGGLAYAFLRGADGGGTGAPSPEEAVEALATSLDEDDLLGALTVMAPDEVGPLSDVFDAALARSGELDLFPVTDTGLAELDVSVAGLTLETEELHPEVVKVTFTGGSIGLDAASPDLGLVSVNEDEVLFSDTTEMEGERDLADLAEDVEGADDTFVVTVEHDGEWYVSPLYTLAEYLRLANDLGDADYGASRGDVEGAESPEAAVEAAVAAIGDFDVAAGAGVLPPGELGIAYDYLELLLEEIDEDELEEDRDDLDLEIDDLTLVEGEDLGDGRRQVIVESFAFSYDDDGERTEGTYRDRCVEIDEEECLDVLLAGEGLDPVLLDLLPEQLYVVVVEDRGGWYVSPMETLASYLTHAVERLDHAHLRAMGLVEPQPLAVDEPLEGELANGFAKAALTLEVEEDVRYLVTLTADERVQASIHPVGEPRWAGGTEVWISDGKTAAASVFTATQEDYAVAVSIDRWVYEVDELIDLGAVPFTLSVTELEIEGELELEETVEIDLDAGQVAAFTYDATGDEELRIQLDGEGTLVVREPDDYHRVVEDGDSFNVYSSGEHLFLLLADEDDSFVLGIEDLAAVEPEDPDVLIDPPPGIDGIPELTLGEIVRDTLVEDGIVDYVFYGTGGEVKVVAAGDDDTFDPVLVIWDEDLRVLVENEGDAVALRAESFLETEEGALYVLSVAGYQGMAGDVRILVEAVE